MSMICRIMHRGDELSCEPVGNMVTTGFLPGTFVRFMPNEPKRSPGAVATIDRCGSHEWAVGFTMTGSQHLNHNFNFKYANDNEKTGLWTTDESTQLIPSDANSEVSFDENNQLSRMGSGIVTVNLNDTGIHRFYVWEKFNKAYRDSDGALGGALDYTQRPGYPSLYVSDRGLLTIEKEYVGSQPITFVLASQGEDNDGKFLVIASA